MVNANIVGSNNMLGDLRHTYVNSSFRVSSSHCVVAKRLRLVLTYHLCYVTVMTGDREGTRRKHD